MEHKHEQTNEAEENKLLKTGQKFSVTQREAMENGQDCAGNDKTKKVAGQSSLAAQRSV